MGFETDFRDLMPHTIKVRTRSSRNSDGSDVFSNTTSSYRGRVVWQSEQVRDRVGNVVMSAGHCWIHSTSALAADSRYQLPSGTGGSTTPPVISVETYPDNSGTHHNKVIFGY